MTKKTLDDLYKPGDYLKSLKAALPIPPRPPRPPPEPYSTLTVELPYRADAKTQAFRVSKRRWTEKDATLISITGLNVNHHTLGNGRQNLLVALDDLPLLLAGIRKVLAGPLEQLLMDAEAHLTTVGKGGSDEPETPG